MKKINCSLIPPCQNTLRLKVARATYIATIWTRSTAGACGRKKEFGWKKEDECYSPVWFNGPVLPTSVALAEDEDLEVAADDVQGVNYVESSDREDNDD